MLVAGRATVCVSTQVGCAVGCAFCASGRLGLRRDLTAEEIVDQVLHFARVLRDERGARVTNVVFMGMGEPFHNYDADAARLPAAQRPAPASAWPRAHISVSTVGVVPGDRPVRRRAAAAQPGRQPARGHRRAARPAGAAQPHLPAGRRSSPRARGTCERTRRKLLFEYVVLRGRQRHAGAGGGAGAAPAPPALPPQPHRLQRDRRRVLAAGAGRGRGAARRGWSAPA